MKNLIIGALALTALLSSCKKNNDEQETPQPQTPTNYYKLAVGNYWIYERWTIDTNGFATNTGFIDSVYVYADTIINGNTYYDYRFGLYPTGSVNLIRDSIGFLVESNGHVLCASNSFNSIFYFDYITISSNDTIALANYTMATGLHNVVVPAGNYNAIKSNGSYLFIPPFDVTLNNGPNPKINKDYYVDGIGRVQYSYYFASLPEKTENRLLRYYVQ